MLMRMLRLLWFPDTGDSSSAPVHMHGGSPRNLEAAHLSKYRELNMEKQNWKLYLCGVGAYVACLVPAMLPIFEAPLNPEAAARLGLAALLALVLTALALLTGFHHRLDDRGASLTQSLLGIAICGGFYAFLAPAPEPQIVLMSLIWIALGLTHLTPRQVLVLEGVYLTVYLNAFTSTMLFPGMPRRDDAVYVLVVS